MRMNENRYNEVKKELKKYPILGKTPSGDNKYARGTLVKIAMIFAKKWLTKVDPGYIRWIDRAPTYKAYRKRRDNHLKTTLLNKARLEFTTMLTLTYPDGTVHKFSEIK